MSSTCEIIRRPLQELAVAPRQGSLAYDQILEGVLRGKIKGLWIIATSMNMKTAAGYGIFRPESLQQSLRPINRLVEFRDSIRVI